MTQGNSVIEPFADGAGTSCPPAELATSSLFRLEVTRIQHYARNPRRQENPEYDRIKASIRAEGLDQPLVITQQPGSADYVLQAGGNTRLHILKALFQETGDDRFLWVDCVLKPWAQESQLLFAHLRENELRGSLPFIDKAHAVFEAKALLETELAVDELSQRQMETLFRERGFSLSHSMISKMGYAVHTLWPLMPLALNAGLGRPQVEKIRSLERAAFQVWSLRQLGDEATFNMIFAELCRRYDSADWDSQPLRSALENELAEESEQSLQVIRLELDAYLAGNQFVGVELQASEAEESDTDPKPTESKRPLSASDTKDQAQPSSSTHMKAQGDGTIDSLRDQLCQIALGLAERHGLNGCIKALPAQGLGFLVRDVPPSDLTETLDEDLLGQVSSLWWQLAACSEITVAPVEVLLAHLKEGSVLYQALSAQDAALLFGSVWTLDPGHIGHQLWQQLSESDWRQLLAMMTLYRQLKRRASDTDVDLWHASEGDG